MEKTKRCSSCKLNRRIELFKKPMSTMLFNTCENCRLKKKNNYHRQKLRRASKEALSHTSGKVHAQSFLLSNSSTLNKCSSHNSPVKVETNVYGYEASSSAHHPFTEDIIPFAGFPTSRWIEVPSPLPFYPVFIAKPIFHYTLCNVHENLK